MLRSILTPLIVLSAAGSLLAQRIGRYGHVGLYRAAVGSTPGGPCLEVSGRTDGSIVRTVADCPINPGPNRTWTLVGGSALDSEAGITQIRIFGTKCLDVTAGVNADGTRLQIWECGSNNPNQLFIVNDQDGTIRWYNHGKCVDAPSGGLGPVQVWTCGAGNLNQRWNPGFANVRFPINEPARIRAIQTHAHTNPNLIPCLAAPTNSDGAAVITGPCVSNGTQYTRHWISPEGGSWGTGKGPATQLRIYDNKCLDVPSGNGADGTKLQIWTCGDGNVNQLWNLNGDGTITWSGQNGRFCLDLTDGSWTEGSRPQIWTCWPGNTNQQWITLPPF